MISLAKFKDFDSEDFEKYRKESEDYYSYRHQKMNWLRHWEYPWVLKYGQFKETDTVMDAGGGYNYFPCILAKYVKEVVVFDKNPISLNHCVTFSPRFVCQNLVNLNITEEYDKIVSVSVIEHIEKWRDAIKNLCVALKQDGLLIMTISIDLDNKRPLFYSDIPEIINILKENSMELVGEQDIEIEDEFTKEQIVERNMSFPEIEYVNKGEERYTTIGIIARKNGKRQ